MSSSLIVPVAKIQKIRKHPNADKLEIVEVLGWQIVSQIDPNRKVGDLVVYFPPDALLPIEWSDKFEVTKYLSFKKSDPTMGRVRCARLRQEPSYGFITKPEDASWRAGDNVADYYGVKKYEPPLRTTCGDAAKDHPLFVRYTDMENLRYFPEVFSGEHVAVTEKIHGTNSRFGKIEGEWMAGSHNRRRKPPRVSSLQNFIYGIARFLGKKNIALDKSIGAMKKNYYWLPYTLLAVRALVEDLASSHRQVILFGEVYGCGVQGEMDYGLKNELGYRAFDLLVDGKYLPFGEFKALCEKFGVEIAPVLYEGLYDLEKIKALSDNKTALSADHVSEGVVVRPYWEEKSYSHGRLILKYKGDTFLTGDYSDYTEE